MSAINFNEPGKIGHAASITITTSETKLFEVTEMTPFRKSQITCMYNITIGSATSVKLRYYFSPDFGVTYFQVPLKTLSTGVLSDTPSVMDTTSPSKDSGTTFQFVEDFPMSGTTAFKITGQAVAANATLTTLDVFARDN